MRRRPQDPQDRIALSAAKAAFRDQIQSYVGDQDGRQGYSKLDESVKETLPASDPGAVVRRTATPTTEQTVASSSQGAATGRPATR